MRTLSSVALLAWLPVAAAIAQEPNPANFIRYRSKYVELFKTGSPLSAALSSLFGIREDARVLRVSTLLLRDQQLELTLSTNTTDILLTETPTTPQGRRITIFHTELTLALHAAASGADHGTLQLIPYSDAAPLFGQIVKTWDAHLPRMIDQPIGKAARGLSK